MFEKNKSLILLIISLLLSSCSRIHEDMPRCELWLKFVFDYNMEYADAFYPQVKSVDVFVFDSDERLLFSKSADATVLTDGDRLLLSEDLEFGKYKVLTVGGLSDNFRISDNNGQDLVPGVTTLKQFRVALRHQSEEVQSDFPHLYFGDVVEVDYFPGSASHTIYQVNLMRYTNRFNIMLVSLDGIAPRSTDVPYTFEIVAPENDISPGENELESSHQVIYSPYSLNIGETSDILVSARLSTLRLLNKDGFDYKFIVRDTKTLNEVWSYNLMTLLLYTKPGTRPDDTELPFQEYLDRQGEWNLIFCVTEKTGGDAFLSIGIQVGNWIHWLHDFEIEE